MYPARSHGSNCSTAGRNAGVTFYRGGLGREVNEQTMRKMHSPPLLLSLAVARSIAISELPVRADAPGCS